MTDITTSKEIAPIAGDQAAPKIEEVFAPVVGTLRSEELIREIARSRGGWIHVDGLVVSMGSLEGAAPLRSVPSAKATVEEITTEHEIMAYLRDSDIDLLYAEHVAQYGNDAGFEGQYLCEQLAIAFPPPSNDVTRDLGNAGWYQFTIRFSSRGDKVDSPRGYSLPAIVISRMSLIAHEIDGYLSSDLRSGSYRPSDPFTTEPNPDNFKDFYAETFAGFPGFDAYDEETRTISFSDRDVTVTLPGGRRPGVEPEVTRAPGL